MLLAAAENIPVLPADADPDPDPPNKLDPNPPLEGAGATAAKLL